jgi:predicted dehydrogenase
MLIHFKTNLIAHAHALDYSNYVIFEMDIFGTHGRLRINLVNNNATFQSTKNSGTISGYKKLDQKPLNYKSSKKSPLSLAVENVVSCVENKKQPLCTGIDGYKSLESVIACKLSAEKNKPISLPIRDMNYKIYSK